MSKDYNSYQSSDYKSNAPQLDWNIINIFIKTYNLLNTIKIKKIENVPEIEGVIYNFIDFFIEELKKQNIILPENFETQNIFKDLKEKYNFSYYKTLQIFQKIMGNDKERLEYISKQIKIIEKQYVDKLDNKKLNWNLVNEYNRIFNLIFKMNDIDRTHLISIPNFPIDFIEKFTNKISSSNNIPNLEYIDTNNIFKYLKEKYMLGYFESFSIFAEILGEDLKKIKQLSKDINNFYYSGRKKLINQNEDLFIERLNDHLEKYDYEVHEDSKTVKKKSNGETKGQIYEREDGTFYLKVFSNSLSAVLSALYNKLDSITLFDIDKNIEVNNGAIEKTVMNTSGIFYDLKKEFFKEHFDKILSIESLKILEDDSSESYTLLELKLKELYNLISKKNFLELEEDDREIYKKISPISKYVDENENKVLFSIQFLYNNVLLKENSLLNKYLKSFDYLEKISDPEMKKQMIFYNRVILLLAYEEYLQNKISLEKEIIFLRQKEPNLFKNINFDETNIEKDYDIIISNIKNILDYQNNKDLFKIIKQYEKIEKINELRNRIPKELLLEIENIVNDFRTFKPLKESMLSEGKINIKNIIEFGSMNLNKKLKDFLSIRFKHTESVLLKDPLTVEDATEIDLKNFFKILDYQENELIKEGNEKSFNSTIIERLTYVNSLKILLFIKSIHYGISLKEEFLNDFKSENDYEQFKSFVEKYVKKYELQIEKMILPMYFKQNIFELNDNLTFLIKNYIQTNKPYLLKDNDSLFIKNIQKEVKDIMKDVEENIIKEYAVLYTYISNNYSVFSDNIKSFITNNSIFDLFLDFNSFKSEEFPNLKFSENSFISKTAEEKIDYFIENIKRGREQVPNTFMSMFLIKNLFLLEKIANNKEISDNYQKMFTSRKSYLNFITVAQNIFSKEEERERFLSRLSKFFENGDMRLNKLSKLNFIPNELKNIIFEDFSKRPFFKLKYKSIIENELINFKIPPTIEVKKGEFNINTFLNYSHNEIEQETNVILKVRTRLSQLAHLTLKIALDTVNKTYNPENYLKYFSDRESLKKFQDAIFKSYILKKDKNGEVIVNSTHKHLSKFLESNNQKIDNLIDNLQGYLPNSGSDLETLFIEELGKLEEPIVLKTLGILNKKSTGFIYPESIYTPEMIINSKDIKGGKTPSYNLRILNKIGMDKQKLRNLFVMYYNNPKTKYYLKDYFKSMEWKDFNKEINTTTFQELFSRFDKLNDMLTTKGIDTYDFIEVPKEPASKNSYSDISIDFLNDTKEISSFTPMFANIASLNRLNFKEPVTIHLTEGVKDGISLSNILSYATDKNQIVLPLQGTKGFKQEFSETLFNLTQQPITIKVWGDIDYAGLTLYDTLKEYATNYSNVSIVQMNGIVYDNDLKEIIMSDGYDKIKGFDITDWLDSKIKKYGKEIIIELANNISSYNSKNHDVSFEASKEILKDHIKMESEKFIKQNGYDEQKLSNFIKKIFDHVEQKPEDVPEINSIVEIKTKPNKGSNGLGNDMEYISGSAF